MEARLADLQISVLKTWVPFYGWAEAVLPSEEGWVGVKRKVMLGSHKDTVRRRRSKDAYVIPIKDAVVPDGGRFEDDDPDTHDFVLFILNEPAKFGDKGIVLFWFTQPNPY